jgi:hypothetical protein
VNAHWAQTLLCVTTLVTGCGMRDSPQTSFVLTGESDGRLPPPAAEERAADEQDRALLQSVLAYHASVVAGQDRASPIAVTWNELTTELGLNAGLPPPLLARAYALTQVAVFDSLVAAQDERRGGLPEATSAAGAASVILLHLFPLESGRIEEVLGSQIGSGTDARRAFCLGRRVGELVLKRANRRSAARRWCRRPPRRQVRPSPSGRQDAERTGTMPPVVARPWACVSWSTSPHRAPPCTRAVRPAGSTGTRRSPSRLPSLSWPTLLAGRASVVLSRGPHRTTVDRGCEVKNLDFTPEGRRATLASCEPMASTAPSRPRPRPRNGG